MDDLPGRGVSFEPAQCGNAGGSEVPTVTTISSTFNGTAIPRAQCLVQQRRQSEWSGRNPVTIHLTDATITSGSFSVDVPDAVITVAIATSIDHVRPATNTWITTVPRNYSGNVFLAGATLEAPGGLPGGIKPVVWQADFTTDTPGVNINWTWAAAVYTNFNTDYNALGVKPIDGSTANPYANSHHAGTPENFTSFVFGGARGGGGSNFTGSYSATKSVKPSPIPNQPAPSSLSGYVYEDVNFNGIKDDEFGIVGVEITLQGTDNLGNPVFLTTTTDEFGFYTFANLRPGTYSIHEVQPPNYDDRMDSIGTGRWSIAATTCSTTYTWGGVNGLDNNFGETFANPPT